MSSSIVIRLEALKRKLSMLARDQCTYTILKPRQMDRWMDGRKDQETR